jgi:hypothetical protein
MPTGLHAECVEFHEKEYCVGRILRSLAARCEAYGNLPSAFPNPRIVSQAHLRGDSAISERFEWILTVATLLHHYPPGTRHAMFARLTRRPKSAERSWEQIQHEVGRLTHEVLAIYDLRQNYQMSVQFIHGDFERARPQIFIELPRPAAAAG